MGCCCCCCCRFDADGDDDDVVGVGAAVDKGGRRGRLWGEGEEEEVGDVGGGGEGEDVGRRRVRRRLRRFGERSSS